jgi:hypothetical protein
MYSGEYDACDVTLSVYPHRASLKNMPDTVGIEPTTFGIAKLRVCSAYNWNRKAASIRMFRTREPASMFRNYEISLSRTDLTA